MIFIPKYTVIEADEVTENLDDFLTCLNKLHVMFDSVTTDKRNIDGKIVNGYTVESRNKKNFVFIQIGSFIFLKDNILHIVEDTDTFFEFYEKKDSKHIVPKVKKNDEKFVCPQCGFISNKPFDKCPNCEATQETCVDLCSTTKKKRSRKMTNPNDDLVKAREEALQDEEAKEVTAVYGDTVMSEKHEDNNK